MLYKSTDRINELTVATSIFAPEIKKAALGLVEMVTLAVVCAIPSRFARLILSRMGRISPPHLLDPKDTPAELFTSAITAATKEVFGDDYSVQRGGASLTFYTMPPV